MQVDALGEIDLATAGLLSPGGFADLHGRCAVEPSKAAVAAAGDESRQRSSGRRRVADIDRPGANRRPLKRRSSDRHG